VPGLHREHGIEGGELFGRGTRLDTGEFDRPGGSGRQEDETGLEDGEVPLAAADVTQSRGQQAG
jgi:hypothetical protein